MRTPDRRRAVVIGAGIGGLAAAVGLVRVGWRVTVLEQSPEPRAAGTGISLLANAMRSLDQLGVGAAVRARSATMAPGGEGVRTPSGRRLMRPAGHARGLSVTVLPRPELHRVLYDALPPGVVRTSAEVTGIQHGSVTCRERVVPADLVVVADGVHSRCRGMLFPGTAVPVYCGHSVWRGIADVRRAEPGGTTWGRGLEFGRMPLTNDRVYWYAVTNAVPGSRHRDNHAEVVRRFGSWHDPIPELLRATPPDTVLYHDVFELAEPLPRFVAGSAALLGDAAHPMTTDLGQGACQAIEDAVVLCAALARDDDVPSALASYDEQRRPRTGMVMAASRRTGQFKLCRATALRNAVLAVTPRRVGERAMARIGDWWPPAM